MQPVHVIGGGLAGSEAAWQLAQAGVPVVLHEMRPLRGTPVHKTDGYAELVCSNSFRSDDCEHNAVGLLHEEMRRLGSLIMRAADENQVPAGGALAVDRDGFSAAVTAALESHPLVTLERGEVIPLGEWDSVIIATGPLTSPDLASAIAGLTGQQQLAFFDAIAPIVHRDSIDLGQAWFQSRYDKSGPGGSGADYINCPLSREQYHAFVAALLAGDKTSFHEWETSTPYFDGCLPIEIMAERGLETLRHGPMKPFGLTNPHQPEEQALCGGAAAAGQQTRHAVQYGRFPNQAETRRTGAHLPHDSGAGKRGVRTAGRAPSQYVPQFAGTTRSRCLRLKANTRWRFAGQITGCEGYVESAAIGLLAGRFAAAERRGEPVALPPPTTAHGALLAHITGGHIETIDAGPSSFQPMNVNFGLFPPLNEVPTFDRHSKLGRSTAKAFARKSALTRRALADLEHWIAGDFPASAAE